MDGPIIKTVHLLDRRIMLEWLEKYWSKGQAFKNGLAITLSGEEKYVIEGYFAAKQGIDTNPYTLSTYANGVKKAEWWRRGWLNYNDSST